MRYLLLILSMFPFVLHAQEDSLATTRPWNFSAMGFYYLVPEDGNYYTFIGTANYKRLHLESRYNYEDMNTGSLFAGWRFDAGNRLQFSATPMLGFVFGNTNGIAPGLEAALRYGKFDLYLESEYMITYNAVEDNFIYTWWELGITPLSWLRTGLAAQRTHLYEVATDMQPGLFLQFNYRKLTAGGYFYNPFADHDYGILTLGVTF